MDEQGRRVTHLASGLNIPWSWLTASLGITTIGTLGTLAVVVSIKNIDVLSTIALALAVLAFAAQLIVSIAQGMAGAQQVAQVERVNADTQSALSALRATSEGLLSVQKEHFGQVLSAALKSAVPEAVGETLAESADEDESGDRKSHALQEAILTKVEEILQRPTPSSPATIRTIPGGRSSRYYSLTEYPTETRGRELVKILKSLTPWETQSFTKAALDSRERAETGRSTRVRIRRTESNAVGPIMQSIVDKGLIEIFDDNRFPEEYYWRDLTDLGVEVASLIVGTDSTPKWLREEMAQP